MQIWIVKTQYDSDCPLTYVFSTREKAIAFIDSYIREESLVKEINFETSKGSAVYDCYDKDDDSFEEAILITNVLLDEKCPI